MTKFFFAILFIFSRDQPLVSDHRLCSTKLDSFNTNFTHLSFRNGLLKRVTDHFCIESQTVKQKSGLVVMEFPKLETFKPEMFNCGSFSLLTTLRFRNKPYPVTKKEMIKYMTVAKMFSDITENLKMDKIIHF